MFVEARSKKYVGSCYFLSPVVLCVVHGTRSGMVLELACPVCNVRITAVLFATLILPFQTGRVNKTNINKLKMRIKKFSSCTCSK